MTNTTRNGSVRFAFAACCLALLGVGFANRWLRAAWATAPDGSVLLDPPLSAIPLRIDSWEGFDVPLDEQIQRVAGADDHINRTYVEQSSRRAVSLYISYVFRPVKMAGHRPGVCYPAHGWSLVQTESGSAKRDDGTELTFLVHEFVLSGAVDERIVVLNYYVLAGRHTTDAMDFRGVGWRRPNIAGDANYYVAQVQVASGCGMASECMSARESVMRFAAESASFVDALLPNTASSAVP